MTRIKERKMTIEFTKMHGLGNDFMVINLISQNLHLKTQMVKKWGDRNFGVGFDQLLVVEPPKNPSSDFCYRIFNQDGSEVENCGNGARCFAKYVRDKKLTIKNKILVDTKAGVLELNIDDENLIEVKMPPVEFELNKIPFTGATKIATTYKVATSQGDIFGGALSLGNPHFITLVEDAAKAPVAFLGAELEAHKFFPQRVNVGFLEIVNKNFGKLRVFERGVGETLACGTGACAAGVYGILLGKFNPEMKIQLAGGVLQISWDQEKNLLSLKGGAENVFEGRISI